MRLRIYASAALLTALASLAFGDAPPEAIQQGGPSLSGVRAVCDLPVSQHLRNTGGIGRGGPGTGAGLCVFTSLRMAGYGWHGLTFLKDFQKWMTNKPGGGYPSKVDAMLKKFCAEKGVPVPGYVQHTGGDEDFLDLCMKTRRLVGITYAGADGFYGGPVAHMVNLAHLDKESAAIIDNNRPGVWVWMTRAELLNRWRGKYDSGKTMYVRDEFGRPIAVGGGWAVAFTAPPPPPYARPPAEYVWVDREDIADVWAGFPAFGQCPGGRCPLPVRAREYLAPIPAVSPPVGGTYDAGAGEAKRNGLPLVTYIGCPAVDVPGCVVASADALEGLPAPAVFVSIWANGSHKGKPCPTLNPTAEDVLRLVAEIRGHEAIAEAPAVAPGDSLPVWAKSGVDSGQLTQARRYWHTGKEVSRQDVFDALELPDDSDKWSLAAVGDAAFQSLVKTRLTEIDPADAAKIAFQPYAPDWWTVGQFGLKPGVNLRKPAKNGVGEDAGVIPVAELTAERLKDMIDGAFRPKPPAPPVPPAPPTPAAPQLTIPGWLIVTGVLAVLWFVTRKQ